MIKYLTAQSRIIARLAPEVARHPDGESVHRLRVATRRARTVLWCLRHGSARLQFKELDQSLKSLGGRLGKIREVDVAVRDAKQFGLSRSDFTGRKKFAQKKLKKWMNGEEGVKLMGQLSSALQTIRENSPISEKEAFGSLTSRLSRQLERDIHGQKKLHQIRIIMKRAEYVLEFLHKPLGPIKRLQSLLGDAHDLEFLQALIGENKKVKAKQKSLNKKAVRIVKPVIRFAIAELGGK